MSGCINKHYGRGYCYLHYKRWWRTGDPLVHLRVRRDPVAMFWEKVDASGDCWEWTASRDKMGYGRASVRRKGWLAHRLAWCLLVGPIPAPLQVDHLCRNPACVNPDHMELVTMQENIRRGAPNNATRWATINECTRGHPYTPENLYISPTSGQRVCRTCSRRYKRNYEERKKQKLAEGAGLRA